MGDTSGNSIGGKSSLDIPIFTEEFLHHNKLREAELRQLRKISTEYEEQNAILSKHLENLKAAVDKLELESVQRNATNRNLEEHLRKITSLVLSQFANIPIPGTTETVNPDNVEQYLQKLVDKVTREKCLNTKECDIIAEKVSKIIAQMD
ncbi:high mobility group protein 20A-like [Panonychus citri]|uniref:high mobility group protein 20A-like n=1 Tax=Panonychus citri TaxID=50023 RepID=UPI002306F823|nr:high mobility group protein 20A-like [Panonychus citri]